MAHYLNRRGRLHSPGVFRLFCSSAVDSRALRADASTREFTGFSRQIQGHWNKDFVFAHISSPAVASDPAEDRAVDSKGRATGSDRQRLGEAVSAINKLRPKFVVVTGDMTAAACGEPLHGLQVEDLRRVMTRLSDSIPVLYVPGPRDLGETPTAESLSAYRAKFGADYYGAWYGGVRCLVLNSPLMINPQGAPAEAAEQDLWFVEEVEQAKLCSAAIAVFAFHPWFHEHLEEADQFRSEQGGRSNFPLELRAKWLQKLRHHKVQLSLSAITAPLAAADKVLRPFPAKKAGRAARVEEEDVGCEPPLDCVSGEPPLPSQVIAAALSSGELRSEDVPLSEDAAAVSLEAVDVVVDDEGGELMRISC